MSLEIWLMFLLTETALSLTPGPAILVVVSQALGNGPKRALLTGAGVIGANAVYFAISATGIGALLLASYELFSLVKWLGAAYLVYLGIRTILGRAPTVGTAPAGRPEPRARRLFATGFVTQAANPKSILFFSALLPQFFDPAGNIALQAAILGVTSITVEFAILAGYCWLGGQALRFAGRPWFAKTVNRVSGGLLITAGVALAALRRI